MVLRKQLRCELTGKKTYDRCVGVRYLDGMKIEEELVRIGLARDCPSIFWRSVPRGRTGGSGPGCDHQENIQAAGLLPSAVTLIVGQMKAPRRNPARQGPITAALQRHTDL